MNEVTTDIVPLSNDASTIPSGIESSGSAPGIPSDAGSPSPAAVLLKAEFLAGLANDKAGRVLPTEISKISISRISLPKRLRQIREDAVEQLMESIAQRGVLQPVTVRPLEESGYELVAGAHRLEAIRRLGWGQVWCRILQLDPLQTELVEIDENLIRLELTEAEWTRHISRRRELYEAMYGSAKARGANSTNAALGRSASANLADAFTSRVATLTRRSPRTIQRAVARGVELGPIALEAIAGTCLDKGVELDALCLIPAEDRAALVEAAKTGKRVSAVQHNKRSSKASDSSRGTPDLLLPTPSIESGVVAAELDALVLAWKSASPCTRDHFLAWLDATK